MADTPILVTDAAGNVGAAVVEHLAGLGVPVRAADLHPESIIGTGGHVAAVRLDLTDPATFPPVLAGVRRVFLIRPPAIARVGPTVNAFIDVAAAAGVEHLVFCSVAGADTNRIVVHHPIETHPAGSGITSTMLRPGFFAQNLATAYRTDIRDHDRRSLPAGDGKVAFIDARDLGELVATILTDPVPHAGQGYTLTGPRSVTLRRSPPCSLTHWAARSRTSQPACPATSDIYAATSCRYRNASSRPSRTRASASATPRTSTRPSPSSSAAPLATSPPTSPTMVTCGSAQSTTPDGEAATPVFEAISVGSSQRSTR